MSRSVRLTTENRNINECIVNLFKCSIGESSRGQSRGLFFFFFLRMYFKAVEKENICCCEYLNIQCLSFEDRAGVSSAQTSLYLNTALIKCHYSGVSDLSSAWRNEEDILSSWQLLPLPLPPSPLPPAWGLWVFVIFYFLTPGTDNMWWPPGAECVDAYHDNGTDFISLSYRGPFSAAYVKQQNRNRCDYSGFYEQDWRLKTSRAEEDGGALSCEIYSPPSSPPPPPPFL